MPMPGAAQPDRLILDGDALAPKEAERQ